MPIHGHLADSADTQVAADALQAALADLVDLHLMSKQAHWTVVGPTFREVHLLLDEIAASAQAHGDEVAERLTALGVAPDGTAATVLSTSGLPQVPLGFLDVAKVLAHLENALDALIARLRESITATGEPDPVTQDLLIGIAAVFEKHSWMVQAQNRA